MLSAHYTAGSSPLHPQQAQYAHHHHTISSLLPTPPSSPPTIGMHPAENTISLLESLVAFYHQERMWVYRTRAQLEMGLLHYVPDSQTDTPVSVEAELHDDPDSPGQLQAQAGPSSDPAKSSESPSPPTKWLKRKKAFNLRLEGISSTRSMLPTVARGGISKHPHPHTQHRARQSSNLNPASVPASSHQSAIQGSTSAALHPHPSVSMASSNTAVSFYPPTAMNTTTLTSPYLCHPSFQFSMTANKQPITPGVATARYVSTPAHSTHSTVQPSQVHATHTGPLVLGAGGREPTVQILEMFERMMQARMESCERVTRMVREAHKPGGIGVGGTGVVGGANLGSVGGPVGGFGGPVGFPAGVGPQGLVAGYSHVQATAQEDDSEMMSTQTPAQQGFMG